MHSAGLYKYSQPCLIEKCCIGVGLEIFTKYCPSVCCCFLRLSALGQRWSETNVSDLREGAGCPAGAWPYNCHTKVGLTEKGNKWNCEFERNVT